MDACIPRAWWARPCLHTVHCPSMEQGYAGELCNPNLNTLALHCVMMQMKDQNCDVAHTCEYMQDTRTSQEATRVVRRSMRACSGVSLNLSN